MTREHYTRLHRAARITGKAYAITDYSGLTRRGFWRWSRRGDYIDRITRTRRWADATLAADTLRTWRTPLPLGDACP